MKILYINRKRLGVTIVIIGLMFILFGLEKNFDNRLKFTALVRSNISTLKEYKALNNTLIYKLPSEWETKEDKFKTSEIIYNNNFKDKKDGISGFVQVWKNNGDLDQFIKNSKTISENQDIHYTSYKKTPITINNYKGYVVCYSIYKNGVEYTCYDYLIKHKDNLMRFFFTINKENFEESTSTVFDIIVKTIKCI